MTALASAVPSRKPHVEQPSLLNAHRDHDEDRHRLVVIIEK